MKLGDFLGDLIIVKACAFDNQVARGCVEIKESLTCTASEALVMKMTSRVEREVL